jgi:branched-chain amino acid transport system permease protein
MLREPLTKRLVQISPYIFFCMIFSLLPLFISKYFLGLCITFLIWGIAAMAYDLLLGYTGLVSFGTATTWGVGAYAVGLLISKGITGNFLIILGVAVLAAIIISGFFGFLALRTSGVYFSLTTLAMAQLLHVLTIKWRSFTCGDSGLTGISRPFMLGEVYYYYLVLVIFIVCYFLMRWIVNSWFGRTLIGIRQNESRMLMLGYNTWAFKYTIFIITGIFIAIGGVLNCYFIGIASPDNFYFHVMGNMLFMVLIGGKGTLIGPIIGSMIVVFLTNFLSAFLQHWLLELGIIFILVVMFVRKGIGGFILEWWQKRIAGAQTKQS